MRVAQDPPAMLLFFHIRGVALDGVVQDGSPRACVPAYRSEDQGGMGRAHPALQRHHLEALHSISAHAPLIRTYSCG